MWRTEKRKESGMHSKPVKLSGMVILNQNKTLSFEGQLYDGQTFTVDNLREWDVKTVQNFLPSRTRVSGYMFVMQQAQQNDVCYVTLPRPSLVHGKHVNVKSLYVLPAHQKIEDFNPSKREEEVEVAQLSVDPTKAIKEAKAAKATKLSNEARAAKLADEAKAEKVQDLAKAAKAARSTRITSGPVEN